MKLIEGRNGYMYVEYSEPYQFKEFIALMREANEVCLAQNQQKLLVHVINMPGAISPMERFELGLKGVSIFQYKIKIAVVYRKEEINRFAETVGVNRGLNTRVFSDLNEAMEWLGVGG